MADPRVENLARTLVQYSTKITEGDLVAVTGGPASEPLINAVVREIYRAGGQPYIFVKLPETDRIMFTEASDAQIQHVSRVDAMVREEFDALVAIRSDVNTRSLSSIDLAKQRLRRQAYAPLMETYMRRSAEGEFNWVGTLFPTQAYAQEADMSLEEFEDFVYSATYSDKDDPVAEWRKIHDFQATLVDWLADKKHLEVKGPNVDMRLSIDGRKFINSDGTHNMPSGEIFTGPVEDSVNGWVRFTYPAITQGREVEGIELTFEDGKVVEATAKKNQDFLRSMLDTDEGARYLGEWAVGTNNQIQRFTKSILFDEKIGGTIHMAVGAGYPETGSQNKSAIHWDMICDMRDGGQIHADGELFYDSGKFMV